MKHRKAFTLIELMIAMVIIAILTTAGIAAYTGYGKSSRDVARGEMARGLNSVVVSYAVSHGGRVPEDHDTFNQFLQSAGSTFANTSNIANGTLLEDPVGGREVCLDAEGNANQPCAFHYTAYDDGTYAISYGVEHETSTRKNFYKTTNSVPPLNTTSNANSTAEDPVPKYGVYTGTAWYIGQPSVTDNGDEINNDDGIDITYLRPGAVSIPTVVFRSIRMNHSSYMDPGDDGNNKANGEPCTAGSECSGGYCGNGICTDGSMGSACSDVSQCSGRYSDTPPGVTFWTRCFNGVCECTAPCGSFVDP